MIKITACSLVIVGLGLATMSKADAAYVAYLYQDGTNVVATGGGSFDLTALYSGGESPGVSEGFAAADGYISIGMGPGGSADFYSFYRPGYTPLYFGVGIYYIADDSSGPKVYLNDAIDQLAVPVGYISGTVLNTSTATFDRTTLANMGVTDGTYVVSWGTGADADSYTLYVGKDPVPEPASLALLGTAVAALGLGELMRICPLHAGPLRFSRPHPNE